MVKRRSEDDGLVPWFSERSRPAEDQAGDRLLRGLRYGAANGQTHLLEVVVSDMAHLNPLVTRALPEWEQGSGSRSSNG